MRDMLSGTPPTSKKDWENILNSIASGVETNLHVKMGLPEMATRQTVDFARRLDIPEEEIQEWMAGRRAWSVRLLKEVESLLSLLRKNALARDVMAHFVRLPGSVPDRFETN